MSNQIDIIEGSYQAVTIEQQNNRVEFHESIDLLKYLILTCVTEYANVIIMTIAMCLYGKQEFWYWFLMMWYFIIGVAKVISYAAKSIYLHRLYIQNRDEEHYNKLYHQIIPYTIINVIAHTFITLGCVIWAKNVGDSIYVLPVWIVYISVYLLTFFHMLYVDFKK